MNWRQQFYPGMVNVTMKRKGEERTMSSFASVLPAGVRKVVAQFNKQGVALFAVGGCVRDFLLCKTPKDFDFTTGADIETIRQLLEAAGGTVYPLGEKFGTVCAAIDGEVVEITRFRSDVYDGVTRKPVVTAATSINDDLQRRDFTINAIAIELDGNEAVVDPFGGRNDLVAMRLRTPMAALQTFQDDPLRVLRAIRFVVRDGFKADAEVTEAIPQVADLLGTVVSRERILSELEKIIVGSGVELGIYSACEVLGELRRLGLLTAVFGSSFDSVAAAKAFGVAHEWGLPQLRDDELMDLVVGGFVSYGADSDKLKVSRTMARTATQLQRFARSDELDRAVLAVKAETPFVTMAAVVSGCTWQQVKRFRMLSAMAVVFPFNGDTFVNEGIRGPEVGRLLRISERSFVAGILSTM